MPRGSSTVPSLLCLYAVLAGAGMMGAGDGDITALAPTATDLEAWAPGDEARVYEGLDLFKLINGGAELYHEYGFQRVLSREFSHTSGKCFISLEIYEMESPASAFGIFSFNSGQGGEPIDVGTEALLQEYYLNIWKGPYLLTLTGADSDEVTRRGLVEIGQAVAEKVTAPGPRPTLVQFLPVAPRTPAKVWYLHGDLALANVSPLSLSFGMHEGVGADYGDFLLFVLAYTDRDQGRDRFETIVQQIDTQTQFTPIAAFAKTSYEVSFVGTGDEILRIELLQEYILMTVAAAGVDIDGTLNAVRSFVTTAASD